MILYTHVGLRNKLWNSLFLQNAAAYTHTVHRRWCYHDIHTCQVIHWVIHYGLNYFLKIMFVDVFWTQYIRLSHLRFVFWIHTTYCDTHFECRGQSAGNLQPEGEKTMSVWKRFYIHLLHDNRFFIRRHFRAILIFFKLDIKKALR